MAYPRKTTLVLASILVLLLVWTRPLDNLADNYTSSGFNRAVATFAAARGLNAVISLVQGASFNVQLGVGASVQPGAVLDPLDDLVEQFSALMLAATMSFSLQRVFMEVLSSWPFCTLISIAGGFWLRALWLRRQPPRWLPRLTLALLCLRLAVPVVALGNEAIYRFALEDKYLGSQSEILSSDVVSVETTTNEGLTERLKRWWEQSADINAKIDQLKQAADELTDHLINLAVVFFAQTLLLPLLFLWLLLQLYRLSFGSGVFTFNNKGD